MKPKTELDREALELQKKIKERHIEEMRDLMKKVPDGFTKWFYQRTVDYKATVRKCARVMNNSRSRPESIIDALNELRSFY